MPNEPQVLTLKVKGEREVTARDITTNPEVEIENPELHLTTLTSTRAELDMELMVEKGLGYEPAELRKGGRLPIGMIALDAIFSPVLNVAFRVQNMRVGERTDYNRLIIEITTDGTLSPSTALHKAVNVLSDHFQKIGEVEVTTFEKERVIPSPPKKRGRPKTKTK